MVLGKLSLPELGFLLCEVGRDTLVGGILQVARGWSLGLLLS